MSGLTLLHDPNNADSVAFFTLFGESGTVIADHAACVAVMANFQGYPTVLYEDASGAQHALYNPADMAAVEAWRQGIDNPPALAAPTVITKYTFLNRFTMAELAAAITAVAGNVQLQAGQKLLDAAQEVDLTDANIAAYMALLVEAGALTQDRATTIMTP